MMSWVPAQANLAFEDASKNTISALGYVFSYAVMISLTLYFKWDLPGIAASFLVGRSVEETEISIRDYYAFLRADLMSFIHASFHELNPDKEFFPSVHLEAIAAKLQACFDGAIHRLISNLPPRPEVA